MLPGASSAPPEAELIRIARDAKGMTISAASQATRTRGAKGVGATYWGDVERGEGGRRGKKVKVRASDRALAAMARVVGVSPAQLTEAGREGAAEVLMQIQRREPAPSLSVIPGGTAPGGNVYEIAEQAVLRELQRNGDPLEITIWTTRTMSLDERADLINGIRKKRAALNGARDVELLEGQRVPTEEGPAGRAGTL